MPRLKVSALLLAAALSVLPAACSEGSATVSSVRLGFFPNLTHAPAILGLEKAFFVDRLPSGTTINETAFSSGPAAVEALFSSAIDATFIGPSPAINAFVKSEGEAVRIVSGAVAGGAALVVAPKITTPGDLRGKKLASPQRGNTQDIALRSWLAAQGLRTNLEGGGDVSIIPQENAQILESFREGAIDGAWVPEPWAARLVHEAGATVLVDEADLWPDREFVTTLLIVRKDFLSERPDVVQGLLQGLIDSILFCNERPEEAKSVVGTSLTRLAGKQLPAEVVDSAWGKLKFTWDPLRNSLEQTAAKAARVSLLEPISLDGLVSLDLLNESLTARGLAQVAV